MAKSGIVMKKKSLAALGPVSKKKLGLFTKTTAKAGKVAKTTAKAGKVAKKLKKARVPYVRQPAKMSSDKWRKLQEGMSAKWPVPKYMEENVDKERLSGCYRDETYMEITRWTSETQIQYRPHAKAPGSKSHTRYEKYSRARTVKDSLKGGSWPADWCYDYEHGFIKVVGGKLRDEPIDSSEADMGGLDEVDQIVAKWFTREAARMLGLTLQQLRDDADAKDQLLLRMKRKIADSKASEILRERVASRRKLTDADVLTVLQSWGFRKNVTRPNVTPDGFNFVFSDTMGLVSDRQGRIAPTKYTLAYPNATKVLCEYLNDHLPPQFPDFCFTGINVNKNYAGKRHRDGNNVGPSIIKAFGNFTGGNLNYFPNDDRTLGLDDLPPSDKVSLDLQRNMALFDGRRAHQVDPFKGERFSLVYFTCPRNDRIDAKTKAAMLACGFQMPTPKTTQRNMDLMAAPSGYGGATKKVKSKYRLGGQKFLTWLPAAAQTQGGKRTRK